MHKSEERNEHGEKMILAHDPVAGYRSVFYATFAVGAIYLVYILIETL
jgi:hypothetical protein